MGKKQRYFATESTSAASKSGKSDVVDVGDQAEISDSDLFGEPEHYQRADEERSRAALRSNLRIVDDDASESEEEVLGLTTGQDDLSTDDENEDDEVDEGPRGESWGKHVSSYYNTDYVGNDTGELNEEEAEIAEREQEEAYALQQKLAQQYETGFAQYQQLIDDDRHKRQDATLSAGSAVVFGDSSLIVSDASRLSSEEQKVLLQKKLPDYEQIILDLRTRLTELHEWLLPSLQLFTNVSVPFSDYGKRYISAKYKVCMSFCRYAVMYIALYSDGENVSGHPVMDKITETRALLKMLDKPASANFGDEMEVLRAFISGTRQMDTAQHLLNSSSAKPHKAGKRRQTVTKINAEEVFVASPNKKVVLMGQYDAEQPARKTLETDEVAMEGTMDTPEDPATSKRPVTYEMEKNKGTTPYRKKEFRNPRIRHKHKFNRAQVRRKGQARVYKPETKKYSGEMGGIKAHIARSVKFG